MVLVQWQRQYADTRHADSVHAMTPAGGVGANTALRDAALVGKLIHDAQGWRPGLTNDFEREMRVYASENVKMSFETAAKRFRITSLK